MHAVEELGALLPSADALVVLLPLTDATRGVVDAEMLAALPDGALVLNAGRAGSRGCWCSDPTRLVRPRTQRRPAGLLHGEGDLSMTAHQAAHDNAPLW